MPRKKEGPEYDGETALENARWEAFAQLYCGEYRRNAAGAYKAAGFRPKNDHVATVTASRMLTNVSIKKRIAHLESEALEKIRLSALDAQARMGTIATATQADFRDPESGLVDLRKVFDPVLKGAVKEMKPIYDKDGNFLDWDLKLYDAVRDGLEPLGLTAQKDDAQSQNNQILVIKA